MILTMCMAEKKATAEGFSMSFYYSSDWRRKRVKKCVLRSIFVLVPKDFLVEFSASNIN